MRQNTFYTTSLMVGRPPGYIGQLMVFFPGKLVKIMRLSELVDFGHIRSISEVPDMLVIAFNMQKIGYLLSVLGIEVVLSIRYHLS